MLFVMVIIPPPLIIIIIIIIIIIHYFTQSDIYSEEVKRYCLKCNFFSFSIQHDL